MSAIADTSTINDNRDLGIYDSSDDIMNDNLEIGEDSEV